MGKEATVTGTKAALKATGNTAANEIGAVVNAVAGTIEIIHEIGKASQTLSEEKLTRADTYINDMINVLNLQMDYVDTLFDEAGVEAIDTYRPLSKMFGPSNGITRRGLRREMEATIGQLRQTQKALR
ncbi:hypothetical protein QZH46_29055 [Pseudomonas corrugata]